MLAGGRMSRRSLRSILSAASIVLVAAKASSAGADPAERDVVYPDWTGVTEMPYPVGPAGLNPVLAGPRIHEYTVDFVADPFLMFDNNVWYMFFEAFMHDLGRGVIGYATSPDGLTWTFADTVLTEPVHLSYPFVFKAGSVYLMLQAFSDHVYLYKAESFPRGWRQIAVLLGGRDYADPTVFRYNDMWWMLVSDPASRYCYLFYSGQLFGPWVEHPMSPIVNYDRSKARPAGRSVVVNGGDIIRLAQKCDVYYGEAVRAFHVDQLTPTAYAEHEIPESPILRPSGFGWNATSMHTFDPWWVGDHWIATVDGKGTTTNWAIGIYRTLSQLPTDAGPASPFAGLGSGFESVRAFPDPFTDKARIEYLVSGPPGPIPVRVCIYDATGRILRILADAQVTAGWHAVVWDGKDPRGARLASGAYYCGIQEGRARTGHRLVLAR